MLKIADDKYVFLGQYPQNRRENEPIKWRIVKREEGVLTLIADTIMLNDDFDVNYSDYERSKVRKVLLYQFVPMAFTDDELALILPTELENGIVDKVFLPSLEDMKAIPKEERIRKVTPWARSQKASAYPVYTKKEKHLENNGWYWTRTPYKPPYDPHRYNHAWYVVYNGSIESRNVWGYDIGIVPMIRVKV